MIRLVVVGLEGHQAKRNTNQYIYCYVVLSCALDTTEVTKLEFELQSGRLIYAFSYVLDQPCRANVLRSRD